jgi:hypothetical protein
MAELCRFYGIIIRMIVGDVGQHHKPHIHVQHAEHEAAVGIDGELLAGYLPPKQMKLLRIWLVMREDELYKTWTQAVRNEQPEKIKPL